MRFFLNDTATTERVGEKQREQLIDHPVSGAPVPVRVSNHVEVGGLIPLATRLDLETFAQAVDDRGLPLRTRTGVTGHRQAPHLVELRPAEQRLAYGSGLGSDVGVD